ncbi:S1 family peptidase [Paraburkholderia sp. ZP32-5]|uniref:S1 family peptidase n=1 Tax=Paraburkholderia sp. ZP32-5 TaxID=2883245 RepID=UPI001F254918|nr:S1 family peptidase [Paraburkholderia sp. ZP32-5]
MYRTVSVTNYPARSAVLQRAHERISDMMTGAGTRLPVTLCHIDAECGHVAVGIDTAAAIPHVRRDLEALAGDAPLRLFHCAPAVRHANKRDHNRPLLGGLYLSCPEVQSEGTLCLEAKRHGQTGFVTCGHVAVREDVRVYQPRQSQANDWLVGQVVAVSGYASIASSDSAFVSCVTGIRERAIWKSNGTEYTVDGIYDAPARGVAVAMQGASTQTTLRTGVICAKNVTVTFDDQGVLTDQLLANYRSSGGDSGAPVFYVADGASVYMVGLNVGATLADHADPQPDQGEWPPADNGTYAVISPWMNVERDLDLTLGLPTVTL